MGGIGLALLGWYNCTEDYDGVFPMKSLIRLAIAAALFVYGLCGLPPAAHATEGRFVLQSGSVSCEGISIWRGGQYQISGRCQGLVYPYAEQITSYALWAASMESGRPAEQIDEIDEGIIEGRSNTRFSRLFITAEGDSVPREPQGIEIASGTVARFEFVRGPAQIQPTGVAQTSVTPTPTLAPAARTFDMNRLVSAGPGVIIFIVVILVVIIAIVMRRS